MDSYRLDGDVGESPTLTAEIKLTVCAGSGSRNAAPMKASTLPTLAQLRSAARARRRRALRRDPYGLRPTVTEVDGRPIRSLSAGHVRTTPKSFCWPVWVPRLPGPMGAGELTVDSHQHRRPSWVARRTCAGLPADSGRDGHGAGPLAASDRAPRHRLVGPLLVPRPS